MNKRKMTKGNLVLAGLLIFIAITAMLTTPVLAQSASANRNIQTQTLEPGESTNITVTITNNITQSLSLDEDIPAGWTLTRVSDDANTFKPSTHEWVWFTISAGETKTVIYNLTVPSNATAADYSVTGTISNATAVIDSVKGEDTITVEVPPAPKSASATRDIDKQTLAPRKSTNITVTITNNVTQALSLDEDIPAGWTLTRVSDDADSYKQSTNEWVWFKVDAGATKTVIYSLTVPSNATAEDYYINGTISNASGVIDTVKGEDSVTVDTTPPVISKVASSGITTSSATITWTTDEPSDSLVKYGTTSGTYPYTKSDATDVTSHSISLTGLSAGTTYYYVVNSTDPSGNSAESAEDSFTTESRRVGGGGGGAAAPPVAAGETTVSTTSTGEVKASVTATSADAKAAATITAGTIAKDAAGKALTKVTVVPPSVLPASPPAGVGYVGYAYDFGPAGTTFSEPVEISITFDPADFEGKTPVVYTYEEVAGEWKALDTTVVDNKAIAEVTHFSTFVLFAEQPKPTPTPTPSPSPSPVVSPTPTPSPSPSPSPKPPGFEAVFAIAGLLAVAYLVLRRRRDA